MNQEKNQKLMDAMSEIDEELIAEARAVAPRLLWVRRWALVACLALIVLSVPLLAPLWDMAGDAGYKQEDSINFLPETEKLADAVNKAETVVAEEVEGDKAGGLDRDEDKISEGTTLPVENISGAPLAEKVSFVLTLGEESRAQLVLTVEVNGESVKAISEDSTLAEWATLLVEDEPASGLPTEAGVYHVTLIMKKSHQGGRVQVLGSGSVTVLWEK